MNKLLESVLAKLWQSADDGSQPATLTANECRVLLIELEIQRSTAAIATTPEFHTRVERYRKTGKL